MSKATWAAHIATAREEAGDTTRAVAVAPSPDVLSVEFYDGYGGSEGPHFLYWTERRVYFPVVYDGAEWVGSAPRNPGPEGQRHIGGE